MNTAEKIITQLGLEPLPQEGGFFRRTWTSATRLADGRAAGSAIWFLITADSFSALHRLQAEELWHFYAGDPVEHVQLVRAAPSREPVGGLEATKRAACVTVLGANPLAKQTPQLRVPRGVWQGARLKVAASTRGWALLGCTVTPAWVDGEFELGSRGALLRDFPGDPGWIKALTRRL